MKQIILIASMVLASCAYDPHGLHTPKTQQPEEVTVEYVDDVVALLILANTKPTNGE